MGLEDTIISILTFIATLLGALLMMSLLISLIISLIILLLLVYSIKTGKILFPNLIINGIIFFESPIKSIARLIGLDDARIDVFCITLKNRTMLNVFRKIPFNKRAIFLPQCLRSITCPATLSPEGIMCRNCGACGIARAKKEAEKLGYSFFVVPGSSFIVRMMKKYKPRAIIGVGCLCEIKEGLDMMHKYKMTAIGVVLETSGCVATTIDWEKFYEIVNLGEETTPEKIKAVSQDIPKVL